MATVIRAEISEKNPYWIEKHRYYELKHFCLQYYSWKKAYVSLDESISTRSVIEISQTNADISNPTANRATTKTFYSDRIKMLERVAKATDEILGEYVMTGIVNGWSYDILKARLDVPCCKDTYYELYRRFFWLLDKERG